MSHWRQMFADEKYLGSYSLEKDGKYQPVVVTIEKIFVGEFTSQAGKESRPFAKFAEFQKPMVLNRTNFKRLEKFFGSFDIGDYVGKQIVLGVETVASPEGPTPALRFSTRPLPQQSAPQMPMLSEKEFEDAKVKLKDGKTTIEKIKKARTLSKEQEDELNSITNA